MQTIATIFALSVWAVSALEAADFSPGPNGKYTITDTVSEMSASFIAYGASITNLIVEDFFGIDRDVIVGYDNASFYLNNSNNPFYGALPGRYVNRIANHTYAMNNMRYLTQPNYRNDTIHTGDNSWAHRFWDVTALSNNSITFSIRDEENSSPGMPGVITANVTYTVQDSSLITDISASALTHDTPLMLTTQPYWNLDSFSNPNTDKVLNYTLSLPYSTRMIGIDDNGQATGEIINISKGSINDFYSAPKRIGASMNDPLWVGNCGKVDKCAGYNNQWILDRDSTNQDKPVASISSGWNGFKMDIYTDQAGLVVYTCNYMTGTNPIKSGQGGAASNGFVQPQGCVATEPHDWIDGINHPEWGRQQIYGPGKNDYKSTIKYTFGTITPTLA